MIYYVFVDFAVMGKQGNKPGGKYTSNLSRRRSSVWLNCTDMGNGRAQCNICWKELAYRNGSTYNLKRHMQSKHTAVEMLSPAGSKQHLMVGDDEIAVASASVAGGGVRVDKKPTTAAAAALKRAAIKYRSSSVSRAAAAARAALSDAELGAVLNGDLDVLGQSAAGAGAGAAMGATKQKILDEALLEMIATDFHPLSIVDDRGFRRFVGKLQPLYKLPTRQALYDNLLTTQYARAVTERRGEVHQATAVCVSAEGWLSQANERYVALTAHYLSTQLEPRSCLLDCFMYTDHHTADAVKDELTRVVDEWGCQGKVVAFVTDSSPHVAAAVQLAGWRSLPCFANMLNVMAQEALKEVGDVRTKARAAVDHFRCNAIAGEMLRSVQQQMSLLPERDLLLDAPTSRWTQTYRMLQRLAELREAVVSALALLVDNVPDLLSSSEWDVVVYACELLRPMYEVTCELAGERYAPASKIILMARGLTRLCRDQFESPALPVVVRKMASVMLASMTAWFGSFETNNLLAEATLLDPRFKRSGFEDATAAEQAVLNVTAAAASRNGGAPGATDENIAYNVTVTEPDGTLTTQQMPAVTLQPSSSIWSDYDQRVYIIVAAQNPAAEAQTQMRQFLEEPLVPRQESCVEWWQSRAAIYPRLLEVVRERMCLVASSAPCDRLYSKSGSVLMDRRSRLDQSEVRQLVFLNANMVVC